MLPGKKVTVRSHRLSICLEMNSDWITEDFCGHIKASVPQECLKPVPIR